MDIKESLFKDFKLEPYEKIGSRNILKYKNILFNFSQKIGFYIPEDYIEIASEYSGIEIKIGDWQYIRIWDAEWCVEMNEAYGVTEFIPQSIAIGDDEGGECLIYLEGYKGFGLYVVGFGTMALDEATYIAPTLSDLLIEGEGVQKILDYA